VRDGGVGRVRLAARAGTLDRINVADINALHGTHPVTIDEPVIIIRIARQFRPDLSHEELYEVTRGWWRVGARARSARWAFSVAGGLVRAVYRIDGWVEPTAEDVAEDARRAVRLAFVGSRDSEMEARYLGADVTAFFPRGAQNAIRYVNC
jgi:hypothetical protein